MSIIDIRNLAAALGGKKIGPDRIACPGPGHSPKDRSLVVKFDTRAPDNFVVYSHSGDDWRECRDYVRMRLGLPPWEPGDGQDRRVPSSRVERFDISTVNAEANEAPRAWTEDDVKRINQARAIWRDAVNPAGTLAEVYLKQQRKLDLDANLAGTVLRFHPSCPWRDEDSGETIKVPALVACFRSITDDAITAIVRVRIDAEGRKVDRRMLGIVNRAAIKLGAPNGELAIGEGIETTLAGAQLGFRPAWALGSVGAISFFPIIEGVKRVIILGEAGEASARAIKICTQRWHKAGHRVRIVMPDDGFDDLNDELMAKVTS